MEIGLFETLKDNVKKYIYCESFVKIEGSKENGFNITESDYNLIVYGMYDEDDLNTEILQIEDIEAEKEGWYSMKCLFKINYDSDDYRSWSMLYAEKIELEFQISDQDKNKEIVVNDDLLF